MNPLEGFPTFDCSTIIGPPARYAWYSVTSYYHVMDVEVMNKARRKRLRSCQVASYCFSDFDAEVWHAYKPISKPISRFQSDFKILKVVFSMRKLYSMHYINFGYSNLFMTAPVDGYFPYQFVSRAKYWTNIHFRLPKRSHKLLCKGDSLSNSYPCGSSCEV